MVKGFSRRCGEGFRQGNEGAEATENALEEEEQRGEALVTESEKTEAAAMAMGRGWRGSEARERELREVRDCEGARGHP